VSPAFNSKICFFITGGSKEALIGLCRCRKANLEMNLDGVDVFMIVVSQLDLKRVKGLIQNIYYLNQIRV
jgi:hypothetical protein